MPAFGKTGGDYSNLEKGLLAMLVTSSSCDARALAINLMADNRSGSRRESAFLQYVKDPSDPNDVSDGLFQYHKTRIKYSKTPEFANTNLNKHNIRWSQQQLPDWLPAASLTPETDIVNFLDLNGLDVVFRWVRRQGGLLGHQLQTRFVDFPEDPDTGEGVHRWLTERLLLENGEPVAPDARRSFVDDVMLALNRSRELVGPYQPSWVALYSDYETILNQPDWVDHCWQAAGVPKDSRRWTMVLRYRVIETSVLARPSQLDAGGFGWHFPTPHEIQAYEDMPIEIVAAGHPMDLRLDPASQSLRDEFLHPQIEYQRAFWDAAGCKLEVANAACKSFPSAQDLRQLRNNHHARLVARYRAEINEWMPVAYP